MYFRLSILPLVLLWGNLFAQCGGGSFEVLHYTETTGFDHGTRSVSLAMFQAWETAENFTITNDNDGSEFNSLANLQQYEVVVFSNTSGDNGLNATQRANFEAYIANGGSYLGIHAASDTYRHGTANGNNTGTWDWYAETVAGASVQESPNHTSQNHNNTMTHQQVGHPTLANVPDPWNKTEEYYYWENGYLSNQFTELLEVGSTGSSSYDAARMMAHCRNLAGGGRAFYTALGHASSNYTSDQNFQNLIRDALLWTVAPALGTGVTIDLNAAVTPDSCGLGTGAISVNASGGQGPYVYNWSSGSTSTSLNGLTAGSYSVTVTDDDGCTGSETINVPAYGTAITGTIVVDNDIDCAGETGTLSVSISSGDDPYTFQWQHGPATQQVSVVAGNYSVTVTGEDGCRLTLSETISEPVPLMVSLSSDPNTQTSGTPNGSIQATTSGGTAPYTYAWTGPDGYSSSVASPDSLAPGTYTLTLTDANGCTTQQSVAVEGEEITSSLDEWARTGMLVTIAPNPTSGRVRLSWETELLAPMQLRLRNAQGQLLWAQSLPNQTTGQSWLDLSHLPAGVYWLEVANRSGRLQRQVLLR